MNIENTSTIKMKSLPAWLCIILFLIGVTVTVGLLELFVTIIDRPYLAELTKATHIVPLIILETMQLIGILFIGYLLLHFGEDKKMSVLGLSARGRFGDICMGFVTALLIMGIGFYLLIQLRDIKILHIAFHPYSFWLSLLFYVLVAFSEEIGVRGYVLGRLMRAKMNKFIALALSSFLFSALHSFNDHISSLPLLNIFLAGILLGATYIYTKNLWYPISLHLFWNFLQGPILGFPVSGMENGIIPMIKLKIGSSSILTGGSFGFEGSITCTILLIIFISITIAVMENKKHNKEVMETETTDD